MKRFWILCLIIFARHISGEGEGEDEVDDDDPYCFRYTWLYPTYDVESKVVVNCTTFKDTPCINPVLDELDPPDSNELLNTYNKSYIGCDLMPGFFCIKYTYKYNNALVNISRFCGKMIEEKISVSSGCYTQYVEGHTIEVCACQSIPGEVPCNGAIYNTFSLALVIFAIAMSLINAHKSQHSPIIVNEPGST